MYLYLYNIMFGVHISYFNILYYNYMIIIIRFLLNSNYYYYFWKKKYKNNYIIMFTVSLDETYTVVLVVVVKCRSLAVAGTSSRRDCRNENWLHSIVYR